MKERGFDEAHALIVRPHGGAYQIVSGHRRKRAAKRAGLTEVPCWVREMSDEEAHMLLLNENVQDGLHPIEEGKHQIDSGLSQRDYAERAGINRNTLKPKVGAARVYATISKTVALSEVGGRWRALAALYSAEPWLWPLWGAALSSRQGFATAAASAAVTGTFLPPPTLLRTRFARNPDWCTSILI